MYRYSHIVIEPLSSLEGDIADVFRFLKSCRYDGVELNLTPEVLGRLDRLEDSLAASGLVVPSFLTGAAYGRGLCLCSPDRAVRRRAVERLTSYLEVARRFNAVLVVGLLQGLRSDEPDPTAANERIVEGLREVGAAAERQGVQMVIEPVNHLQVGFNNSVTEVRRLIQAIGSPAFKPMVDTIHMNIEESSLTQPILDCGKDLRHVHLCESNGGLFGSGHIDFRAVLKALDDIGYEGFASVKIYRLATLKEAAVSSIEHLRRCVSP